MDAMLVGGWLLLHFRAPQVTELICLCTQTSSTSLPSSEKVGPIKYECTWHMRAIPSLEMTCMA